MDTNFWKWKIMGNITQEGSLSKFGKILLVDDSEDIIFVLKETISSHTTLEVLTASNGKEALTLLENQEVDVIILDLSMPAMDGLELFKLLRNRSIKTPVIFLTGQGTEEKQSQALELGAFDFLQKPVKARDLVLLVDEAFKVVQRIRKLDGPA